MNKAFKNLPDNSRLWIYGFSRKLDPAQIELVKNRLQIFIDSWLVHKSQVEGGFELYEKQFVFLASNDTISGCSIDSSVSVFKELKQLHGLDALDQNLVFYRNEDGDVESVSRSVFQQRVNNGLISPHTKVFNLMINSYGSLREEKFETNFVDCWHSKVFKLPQKVIS